MIKLTTPAKAARGDGNPSSFDIPEKAIYVNPAHIVSVQEAASGGSMLLLDGDKWVHVLETPREIAVADIQAIAFGIEKEADLDD